MMQTPLSFRKGKREKARRSRDPFSREAQPSAAPV
jgi:hypothetical protein